MNSFDYPDKQSLFKEVTNREAVKYYLKEFFTNREFSFFTIPNHFNRRLGNLPAEISNSVNVACNVLEDVRLTPGLYEAINNLLEAGSCRSEERRELLSKARVQFQQILESLSIDVSKRIPPQLFDKYTNLFIDLGGKL